MQTVERIFWLVWMLHELLDVSYLSTQCTDMRSAS